MLRLSQIKLFFVAGVLGLVTAVAFAAPPSLLATHDIIKGNFQHYALDNLPPPGPVLVYVYASSGTLVGVMPMLPAGSADARRQMLDAIDKRDFQRFQTSDTADMDKIFKAYLADMGYPIQTVVSDKTPFTLLVTLLGALQKDPACAKPLAIQKQLKQTLFDAAEKTSVRRYYTIKTLELESSAAFPNVCGNE